MIGCQIISAQQELYKGRCCEMAWSKHSDPKFTSNCSSLTCCPHSCTPFPETGPAGVVAEWELCVCQPPALSLPPAPCLRQFSCILLRAEICGLEAFRHMYLLGRSKNPFKRSLEFSALYSEKKTTTNKTKQKQNQTKTKQTNKMVILFLNF